MLPASNTTEGWPSDCPICGKKVWSTPSQPTGDATCPDCGNLLWFEASAFGVDDPMKRLAELGAEVEVDAEGQVQAIRFSGKVYDDSTIGRLGELVGIPRIDIRDTAISYAGAIRLRRLLPGAIVEY